MIPGVDPTWLARTQQVSKHIKCKIIVDYTNSAAVLMLSSDDVSAQSVIPQMLRNLTDALATQLSSFFHIEVKLTKGNILGSLQ